MKFSIIRDISWQPLYVAVSASQLHVSQGIQQVKIYKKKNELLGKSHHAIIDGISFAKLYGGPFFLAAEFSNISEVARATVVQQFTIHQFRKKEKGYLHTLKLKRKKNHIFNKKYSKAGPIK